MRKMLIAYDASKGADFALEDLRYAGLPDRMWVKILTVVDHWVPPDVLTTGLSIPDYTSITRIESRRQAALALRNAFRIARKASVALKAIFPGWKTQAIARVDTPGWAILKVIGDWRPDLVVVGCHSHSRFQRFFLGSVSQKIAAEASCSVHVARPRPLRNAEPRIILAVDGSLDSLAAVQEVRRRKWPAGTKCRLVSIVDPKADPVVTWPALSPDSWETFNERLTKAIFYLAESLRGEKIDTEVMIFDGDPKTRLQAEINDWNADLVFIGAQGLHHGARSKLGSLASRIATRAGCSVEIIRGPIKPIANAEIEEAEAARDGVAVN